MDEVLVDAEVFGDATDCVDVVDLVALHVGAAADWRRSFAGFQFQGRSSSNL